MIFPELEVTELSVTNKLDTQGRRVPVMSLTVDSNGGKYAAVTQIGIGYELVMKEHNQLSKRAMSDLIQALSWFHDHAHNVAKPPPPKVHTYIATPKKAKAKSRPKSKAKAKTQKPTTSIHPSHYPDEVTNAPPPPPVDGGYPTDTGVWEKELRGGGKKDEYGDKDVLRPI